MPRVRVEAEPAALAVDLAAAAFVIIDMQRDFLEPGGFGEALGNDVSRLRAAVAPCGSVLTAARRLGLFVIHTREGHRPDLSDAPPHKVERGDPANRIGARGPMGRILIRGEPGHDIIPELYPLDGEPVIDKPGKGAFYQTDLELMLRNRGIDTLFVAGVTTEVCVNTTVREANDRGFRCIVLARLLRLLFSGIPRRRTRHDQGAGRHFRLGDRIAAFAPFAGDNRQSKNRVDRKSNLHHGESDMTTTTSTGTYRPVLWTTGDWNAFFGFGTNILVNMLVLTGLLRFVLKMPDSLVFGRILPALGMMMCLSTFYYAYLAYRLAKRTGRSDVCALPSGVSVPHMFIVTFVIMLPISLTTNDPIQGWEAGLGLGVLPELHPDDRRFHRAAYSQDHAARRAARNAGRRVDHLHLDAPGAGNLPDARDRADLLCHHHGELARRLQISERHSRRIGGDRRRNAHRLGLQPRRSALRRLERQRRRRRICKFWFQLCRSPRSIRCSRVFIISA